MSYINMYTQQQGYVYANSLLVFLTITKTILNVPPGALEGEGGPGKGEVGLGDGEVGLVEKGGGTGWNRRGAKGIGGRGL